MKEETVEFVDLMMQEEYGRPLREHEKKFLKQITKDTLLVFPRHNGRRVVDFMLLAGRYYEAMMNDEGGRG